jgi:hypothetical protein
MAGKADLRANQCVPSQSSLDKRNQVTLTEASKASLQTTVDKSLDKNKT